MGRSFYLWKNRDNAVMLVSGWLRDGIPQRKRGPVPKYSKPGGLTVKSAAGLTSILMSIEKTGDLKALQLKGDPPPVSITAIVNSEKGDTF